MNVLPQSQYEVVMKGILAGMSLREICHLSGAAKQTVMKIKRGEGPKRPASQTTRAEEKYREYLSCLNKDGCAEAPTPSLARSWRFRGLGLVTGNNGGARSVPSGRTVDVTCGNPLCFVPEHTYLRARKSIHADNPLKQLARRIEKTPLDDSFVIEHPGCETDVVRLRMNLMMKTLARFSFRTLPEGGLKIIRVGTYESFVRGTKDVYSEKHHPIYVGTERDWEPEYVGDCILAPTANFALPKRREGIACEAKTGKVRAVTCGNSRCYAAAHLYLRDYLVLAKKRNDIGSVTLGMFWGTSKEEIPIADAPRCAIRGCAFLSHGESSLCIQHQQFFEADGYEPGVIDVNDMFADDNGNDAVFTVGMLWEDRYNWLNVRKEGAVGKSAAERENDAWWEEHVTKKGLMVEGVVTPKIRGSVLPEVLAKAKASKDSRLIPGVGAQTSLHGKMRNHSKKKIRKVQRQRPAGWHGGHGDHDPKYFSRETIRGMEYREFEEVPNAKEE